MKLSEALGVLSRNRGSDNSPFVVHLVVGFTPLHLKTFLGAYLATALPDRAIDCRTPLYGDVPGALEEAVRSPANAVALALEWPDLDPRLGYRRLGGWTGEVVADVVASVRSRLAAIRERVAAAAQTMRVGICLPSLPLPPIFQTPRWQAGAAEWALLGVVAEFAGACAGLPGVVVVNPQALATPPEGRHDVRADLAGDFPYRVEHVSAVAEALARAVSPPAPLKGIITDLDDTLWRGLVGEVGPEGVTWDLDHKSQGHALYQQMLASLADAGVLVAVASKNDAGVVDAALASPGLRIARDRMFPVEASWGLKSEAVARILAIWNIGADSVVFVDDSPLELAEVAQRFPDMRCTRFPTGDDAELLRLLGQMRDWFGKERVGDEDRLRLDSIRRGAALMAAAEGAGDEDAFLHGLGAKIAVDFRKTPPNPRAPELINKTNQFNLNGRRVDAADWKRLIDDPASFLAVVSYEDKFGPLGAIAVAAGTVAGDRLRMHHWVLSCRAFSRRIEHRTLAALFEKFPVEAIELDFVATARNGPFAAFLAAISVDPQSPAIGRQAFAAVAPAFPIEMVTHE